MGAAVSQMGHDYGHAYFLSMTTAIPIVWQQLMHSVVYIA